MVRKLTGMLLLCLGLLGLGGCVFDNVDEMYALPKSSEAYVNLQAKINEEKGSAEYIAPLEGENRQTIQLVDVDGDGKQEAVAFFRDETSDNPLKIVIFKQDHREDYQVFARIEGMGSEIKSIDYLDLCGDAGSDILVGWQASASVHTLAGYSIAGGQPVEILRTSYGRCLAADLDQDGRQELALAQADSTSAARWRIEYYDGREGLMELVSSAPLSEGATDISDWTAGTLADGSPGLFVTSYFGKDVLITDVFSLEEEGLRNISLKEATRQSPNTFHSYAGVHPGDINGDGVTEVPVAREVAAYGSGADETFWWLDWKAYGPGGTRTQVVTTYHSGDGWYLEIPDAWRGDFSMSRQESSATGVRSVIFARGVETEEDQPKPFLILSALEGSDREEQAQQGERILLRGDKTTLYTGEFLAGWSCGLDQETLKERFHLSGGSWNHTR